MCQVYPPQATGSSEPWGWQFSRSCVSLRIPSIGRIFCREPLHIPDQVRDRLSPENAPGWRCDMSKALTSRIGSGKSPTRPSRDQAEDAVRTLIRWAGDDPDREGLGGTPGRVARAYGEWF